jgi:SulP family sulfate permease
VLGGVLAVAVFDLDSDGVAIVGQIESGLPSLGLPDLSLSDAAELIPGSIGLMLVGFAEGLGAAKTYAEREHYDIDVNRELIGLGGANLAAGLSGGMVVNGSLSKTAVNGAAGARTQLSGLVVAVMTVITLLFLTGLFEQLPEATLAAIVIAAVVELVDIRTLIEFKRVYTRRLGRAYGVAARPDFLAAIAALFGVLIFDTLPGLFIGIGTSLLLLLYRTSRPHVAVLGKVPGTSDQYADIDRHPENIQQPGVVVLRVESGLFFGNADWVRARIRKSAAASGVEAIVIDAESIPSIDISAVRMLDRLADDLERSGVRLLFARNVGQVRDVVRRVDREDDRLRVYPTIQAAVDAASAHPRNGAE